MLGSGTFPWFAVLLTILTIHLTVAAKYNVTSEQLDHCLHYIANDGYRYKKFFQIRPDMQHPLRNASQDLVLLKLFVHAEKDVHILLSSSVQPALDEPVYEIVLDAGGETFSEIRSRLRSQPLAHSRRTNVIERHEVTPVVIRVTNLGQITVTLGNETEPVLNATDSNRTSVKYLSFASWRNGMWMAYFDCHSNKTTTADGDGDQLEEVDDALTKCERKLAATNKYNVTSEDINSCLHYYVFGRYHYQKFYKIRRETLNSSPDDLFHLKLYVQAFGEVHILLSSTAHPPLTDAVYEISLDAGDESRSELRNRLGDQQLANSTRRNVIDANVLTPLVIRLRRTGQFTVHWGNGTEPLLSATVDPEAVPIRFLSFSGGNEMDWTAHFDCHSNRKTADGDGDDLIANDRPLSTVDRLRLQVLSQSGAYDVTSMPPAVEAVQTQLAVAHVDFATATSTLSTRLTLTMRWRDERLRWNPDEFEGRERVLLMDRAANAPLVWTPDVYLFNARGDQFTATNLQLIAYADHTGAVTAESRPLIMRTLCTDRGGNIHGQWPFDELSCDLEIGMLERPGRLQPVDDEAIRIDRATDSEDTSGWQLQQVSLVNETVNDVYTGDIEDGSQSVGKTACDIVYRLKLHRNSTFYVRVFVGPLLLVHAMLLASFCCGNGGGESPRMRASLCALSMLVTTAVLLMSGEYAPNSYVPRLIRWYEATLWMCWMAFVMLVVDRRLAVSGRMWQRRSVGVDGDVEEEPDEDEEKASDGGSSSAGIAMQLRRRLRRMMQVRVLRLAFGLEANNSYDRMTNNKEDEMPDDGTQFWLDVRSVLDRLAFIVYAGLIVIGCSIGIRT